MFSRNAYLWSSKKIAEEEKNPYITKKVILKLSENTGLGQIEENLMISALEIIEKKTMEIKINFNDIYSIKYEEPTEKKSRGNFRQKIFKNTRI